MFDALTSVRPYKAAWPLERVLEHFKAERGKHFDPNLVDLMMPLVQQFMAIRARFEDGVLKPG